ncbi:MAG: biotin/lipoyl-binding protein, partial [Myxococcales bacterium]|nr:biotin/lipoyl-binding protein [Myxococcales bacterium]
MTIAVELPSLGESVYEGTVARWLVAEGDMVEVDQPIVEVTTDKVDAEIPAPSAGMIEQILVSEGDVVEVGAVLARIDPDAKPSATPSSEPASVPAPPSAPAAKSPPEPASAPTRESAAAQAPSVPATP